MPPSHWCDAASMSLTCLVADSRTAAAGYHLSTRKCKPDGRRVLCRPPKPYLKIRRRAVV